MDCRGSKQVLDKAAARGRSSCPASEAFRLYDTHGIPQDFIEDMIESRRLTLDREGFDRAMEGQREKRAPRSTFKAGAAQDAAWDAPDDLKRVLEAPAIRASAATSRPAQHAGAGGVRRSASFG